VPLWPPSRLCAILVLTASSLALPQQPYVLHVHTDEVALTFHAVDENGRAITDLTPSDLRLRDNGRPPDRITLFVHHTGLPLRAAILFDESDSMQNEFLPRNVANLVARNIIHDARDQALVMRFDFDTQLQQDWTSDPHLLLTAAAHVTDKNGTRLGGTAIWDTLYRTCRDHIPAQAPGAETTANAILLFTDGIDNQSHARPQDVIDLCQERETAIYPFLTNDRSHFDAGQKLLRTLAEQTGGRVFYTQSSSIVFSTSILTIDQDLRDRYTLVYRPEKLKRDGSFHIIKLDAPHRTAFFITRTGYNAEP
jgi:Ca-activated chloride channel family protein